MRTPCPAHPGFPRSPRTAWDGATQDSQRSGSESGGFSYPPNQGLLTPGFRTICKRPQACVFTRVASSRAVAPNLSKAATRRAHESVLMEHQVVTGSQLALPRTGANVKINISHLPDRLLSRFCCSVIKEKNTQCEVYKDVVKPRHPGTTH